MKIKTLNQIILFVLFTGCIGCATVPKTEISKAQSITVTPTKETQIGPKRKIAVVEFENKTSYGARRLGTSASDILVTELVKTNKFIVVERDKLNKILDEQKLAVSGVIDSNTAVKMGKLLGLNAIVIGGISQFGVKEEGSDYLLTQSRQQVAECSVDIRVIDVETGEILYADSGKGITKKKISSILGLGTKAGYDETLEGEALRAAIVQFVDNIVSQVNTKPWYCKVTKISQDNIYLNAGQQSGIKIGTVLKVYNLGETITDPDTGKILGREETETGEIEVYRYFGENGSIAKLISGKIPKEEAICKLK